VAIDNAYKRQAAFIDNLGIVLPDGSIISSDRGVLLGFYPLPEPIVPGVPVVVVPDLPLPEPGPQVVTNCDSTGEVLYGSNLDFAKPSAVGWFYDNRYHLSLGGRTLALDLLKGFGRFGTEQPGWTDIGYGFVSSAVVASVEGYPEDMVVVMRNEVTDPAITPLWPVRGKMVRHHHRMLDLASVHTAAPFEKTTWWGAFDGLGPDRTRSKWAVRLKVWGDYPIPNDDISDTEIIGYLTLWADRSYSETYPIWPLRLADFEGSDPPRVYGPGVLLEQTFTPGMVGYVLEAELTFNVDCVHLRQARLEYVPIT